MSSHNDTGSIGRIDTITWQDINTNTSGQNADKNPRDTHSRRPESLYHSSNIYAHLSNSKDTLEEELQKMEEKLK